MNVRLGALVLLSFCTVGASAEEPPYKRILQGNDATKATAAEKKIEELREAGSFREAQAVAGTLLELRRRLQGEDHWQTGEARRLVGTLEKIAALSAEAQRELAQAVKGDRTASQLEGQGRYTEAAPLRQQQLEINRRYLGDAHPNTARSLGNQAENLNAQGKYGDAEPLYRKTLAIRRQALGEAHPDTAASYNNLGENLYEQGNYEEAELLYEKALSIWRQTLGEAHPDTAQGYHNLALNLNSQGKYGEAEPLYQKALSIWRQTLGEAHPHTALSYSGLALNLNAQGRYGEAEPLLQKALAILRQARGEAHPDTSASYENLAGNLSDQGKYAEAEPLYQKALAIRRQALGESHPDVAISYNNMASNLYAQGKYREAEPLYQKALAIYRQALGETHPDTAHGYNNLANNLNAEGKYAQAEPLYQKALAICRQTLGEAHPHTASTYNNLADSLDGQGKHGEAEPLNKKALALYRQTLGEAHPLTAQSYNNVALNLHAQGKYAEAESLGARAMHTFEVARWRSSRTGLERASVTMPSPFPSLAACRARLGQPVAAWRALEAGLARGLLDDLSAARTQSLSPDERKRLDTLNARLEQLDQQITALLTNKEQNEASTARYRELAAKRQAATAELDRFASDRAAREVYDLDRIQALLPAATALISWVDLQGSPHAAQPGSEHWACVVRRTGAPVWVRLAGSGPQEEWTEKDESVPAHLRLTISERPKQRHNDWQELRRQAAAQRLNPLEPHLRGVHHMVVLPAWTMAGLPVEALTDRYTVSYAPSATLFARLQEQRRKLLTAADGRPVRANRLLALGDPDFRPETLAFTHPDPPPPSEGVVVSQVSAGSDPEQHGLKPDDVLLSYAGTKLKNAAQLRSAVEARQKAHPQDKEHTVASVPLQVWRRGKVQDLTVRPGLLGVELSALTPAEAVLAKRSGDRAVQRSRGTPFAPLPGTRIETQAIARLFPESLVLLGAEASAQRLAQLAKADQLRQYRYLHLATHGIVNHRIALYSALLLAQDPSADPTQQTQGVSPFSEGRLTAEEMLHSWKLNADLVVLSACQSALGKQAGGEGYLGFTQALFLAGARSLVLSLWKVDDIATELLMVRFYENLLGKRQGLSKPLPKAEALRESKQWLRELSRAERDRLAAALQQVEERGPPVQNDKPVVAEAEGPPYAHPYYWAAFVLYGDPE